MITVRPTRLFVRLLPRSPPLDATEILRLLVVFAVPVTVVPWVSNAFELPKVALLRSEESRMDNLADPSSLGDLDENDPKSLARWMRKMSGEMGEDLGDEFREVVDRLEAGEDPEEIEKTMPDLAGAGGGDDFGVMD